MFVRTDIFLTGLEPLFEMENVELNFSSKALKEIAYIAINHKTGARGLRAIMEKFMLEIMYNIPEMENVEKCNISDKVVNGTGKAKFEFNASKKNKIA